jgi:hypothetical protein
MADGGISNPNPCPQCGAGQNNPHNPTCPNG